jgi:hypothetical protein
MEKDGAPLVNASIFRKECCFDTCMSCTVHDASNTCIYSCPTLFSDTQTYRWREFETFALDNGNQIRELRDNASGIVGFRTKFTDSLTKYKKHYFQYRWLNLCRKVDFSNIGKDSIFIQTDYSAQPILDSQDKLNSQGHGVCVLSCWVVLHSPERRSYQTRVGETVYYTYCECDHVRVVTPSTGKQKDQDWFLHCKIFEHLLLHYKDVVSGLQKVVVWTDGAPNQYKCRHNFYWVANVKDKFGLTVHHRFGATAQFKGVHDKIGQVAKWVVR